MPVFSAYNFGCRLNQAELSSWIREFKNRGFIYSPKKDSIDFLIVHTCTLTKRADSEIRRLIRHLKREKPNLKVIVAGCMVHTHREFFKKNNVDLILDNTEKNDLVDKTIKYFNLQSDIQRVNKEKYLSRGFLKIADGCNYGCTYCIIPYVRGKAVSISEDRIENNLKSLIEKGYREIVITGVNIAFYRMEEGIKNGFLNLLKRLVKVRGDFYLRLTSLDPRLMNDKLMDFLINEDKIASHFHISIQNGSEKVLKRMGRWVPIKKYYEILEKLNKKRDVLLSADYIVGFSGEDDVEFEKGKKFLENSQLNYLHIFRFSPREGTPAAKMKHPPQRIAKERYDILKEFHRKRYGDFISSKIGKELRAILISKNRALTENYINTKISISTQESGDIVNVKIIKEENLKALGEIL